MQNIRTLYLGISIVIQLKTTMALSDYSTLSELEAKSKFDWVTRARVSSKWRQVNRNGHVSGVYMILVDEFVS